MDLIDIDRELILDALHLMIEVRGGHYLREWANREVLSHALELATDPVIILFLFPPAFQFVNCFAQHRIWPDFLWVGFLQQGRASTIGVQGNQNPRM